MRKLLCQVAAAAALSCWGGVALSEPACPSTLDFRFPDLVTDAPRDLCAYRGQVVLIVNTASQCGFTPQYEGLQKLYARYRDRGFVVLGFPSDDFAQEPDSNRKIAQFCQVNYGVSFPMFDKSSVTGARANGLFKLLAAQTGRAPQWNFYKYLLDRQGRPVEAWSSMTGPGDRRVAARIEQLLAQEAPR